MKVYVFGNQDVKKDNIAIKVADRLKHKIEEVKFVLVKPNEDLPFAGEKNVVILDSLQGAKGVTIINEDNLETLKVDKSVSVHDWDLGFQLKYLQKLGKLKKITIIGLPMEGKVEISTLKKLILKLV